MAEQNTLAIQTHSLTKIFAHRQIAVNCVDLEVDKNSVWGILGPNGAGKTTLVRLLMGLHAPTAGHVFVLGKRMTPNAAGLRRRIGYLPADPQFPPGLTPIEYLDYVGRLHGLVRSYRRPRLANLLRAVELQRHSGEKILRFSTGMRTRVAIAASLINDPEVLIWDEPVHGLDPSGRRGLLDLMRHLAETKTILVCSHNLDDIQEVCQQAMVLHEGQVIHRGPVEQLSANGHLQSIDLTLVGERKDMAEVAKQLAALKELAGCKLARNTLRITLDRKVSAAATLANVLITLSDKNLEVADLRTGGGMAERGLRELLIEEESRGLTRAHRPTAA